MSIRLIIQYFFMAGAVLYLISFAGALLITKINFPVKYIFFTGLSCNFISLGLRYWICFPMLPLYQGAFFLPFIMGITGIYFHVFRKNILPGLFLINILAWSALFFPNDFYLPFLQFKTLFSHCFFLLGIIGKSMFLLGASIAVQVLFFKNKDDKDKLNAIKTMDRIVSWGFIFWTFSVFAGAIWSWLGWGSPVIWDDPLIATTMATWLLYSFLLHLRLTMFSNTKVRAWFFLGGGFFVFFFNCVTELGQFKLPGGFI